MYRQKYGTRKSILREATQKQVGVSIMSDCGARNQTTEVLNKGKK